MCFLYHSCCEEMVTHRAQFNSYDELCYGCSNESRKVINNKLVICLGYQIMTKVTNTSLLLTLFPSFFLSQLHLTLHSCVTQTTKKIEYTK